MAIYDPKSLKAEEFINDGEILDTLKYADENKDNMALIDEIIMRLGSCESLKHSHANKDTLDAISSETKGGYDGLVAMLQGIETIANNLTDSISSIPNSHAVAAYVTNAVRNADFVKPNQLLDSVYPVGTIYTTTSATFNPSTTFGGVWSLRSTEGGVKSYERTA